MSIQETAEKDQAAGVTPAAPWRVKALSVLPGYRLTVTFQDGTSGIADLSAITRAEHSGIYYGLKDPALFAQARIELGVVVWPNGADFDPAWMYENISIHKTWSVPNAVKLSPHDHHRTGL